NGDLDVDGHTNLDNVSVAGVTTFSGSTVNVTGEIRIENESPLIRFIDSNNNPDYWIQNNNGGLRIRDITNAADRFTVHSDGHVDINGNLDCLSGIDVTGNATVSGDLDVDGHTNLDNVSIAGFTTITQDLDVDGHTNLDNVSIAGVTSIASLTSGRVILAGTGGKLEDSNKFTFDGTTLGLTGNANFTGNLTVGGVLTYEDVKNVDAVGLITARSGIRVTGGVIEAQAGENKIP
ncbi:MAG: hypothetical protein VXY93_16270, partial [Pseudomonadota bacterium]|nr:hypothetical protein [Pseudomonadota bacterium]